jgi:anti-anti-sigma factor
MKTTAHPALVDVSPGQHDGMVAVLSGEIVVRTAPEVRRALQMVIDSSPPSIVFDLHGVSQIDVAGLAAITAAAVRARRASIEFTIVPPSAPAPRQLVARVGVVPILNRVGR